MRRMLLVGVLGALLLGLVCLGVMAEEPRHGGLLKMGVVQDITTFDPHVFSGVVYCQAQMNVYDQLVTYATNGDLTPQLAVSWETEDSQVYVFHLREGVKFSNGNPLTADDVVYSFERILNPDTVASRREAMLQIDEVEAVDNLTVKITLEQPNGLFLGDLAVYGCSMVDKEWAEAGGNYTEQMMGTGPFMLSAFEKGVQYSFVRNPNYWEEGKPYLDGFVLVFIENATTRVNALKNGEVDLADFIPWAEMPGLGSSEEFKLVTAHSTLMFVRLNSNREPLDNRLVRQALNYAIDRELINTLAWGGFGMPLKAGLIPAGTYYYGEDLERWEYDPEKAVALLAKAGYEPQDVHLVIESMDWVGHSDSATIIREQLASLGIDIELKIVPIPQAVEQRQTGDYQMQIDGQKPQTSDPDFYTNWFHSQLGGQYAAGVGFSLTIVDELLEQGRLVSDPLERQQIYYAVEALLLHEAPWIFIQYRPDGEAAAEYVEGYAGLPGVTALYNQAFLENVWLDK